MYKIESQIPTDLIPIWPAAALATDGATSKHRKHQRDDAHSQ